MKFLKSIEAEEAIKKTERLRENIFMEIDLTIIEQERTKRIDPTVYKELKEAAAKTASAVTALKKAKSLIETYKNKTK